ncbi:MAG: hydrogen gas-evolving membrane-bound hydrogenase subunit E [Brotaphodocola sp.]
MSRRKDNYENSRWMQFKRWVDGETDPLANGMEIQIPDDHKETDALESQGNHMTESDEQYQEEMEKDIMSGLRHFHKFYYAMSMLLCAAVIFVLLWTVAYLPTFGDAANPSNNEVSARYIERGLQETGAVNMVTGMILDYRAFDTFGESCVLFIASCCVLVLLRIDHAQDQLTKKRREEAEYDRLYEPKNDIILQKCAMILVPVILLFGIYIVLNGHLSPGGGFSGGAVLGSGLILYLNAFGFKKTERFFTDQVYRRVTLCALTFYCLAKSYSFFTGANHLQSGIPLGTPGAIISSGLILPLNICVGLVVACTMYAFYTLFRKGGM